MSQNHLRLAKLNKRKRGILRKAIELSDICAQEIVICMYDRISGTLVQYQSHPSMGLKAMQQLSFHSQTEHQIFDNNDYDDLNEKFLTREVMAKIQSKHQKDQDKTLTEDSGLDEVDQILKKFVKAPKKTRKRTKKIG